MAYKFWVVFLVLTIINSSFSGYHAQINECGIDKIISFGDSIADTGNLLREGASGAFAAISSLPYGETYFHRATGRCSNGLLMIDFLAMALNLPLVNPYLERDVSFNHGVNFAVAGATALDASFFKKQNIQMLYTSSSLGVQHDWFKTYLSSICFTETGCKKRLNSTLFLLGEIGGNDYNYAFFQGKNIEEVSTYVPRVVKKIKHTATELIHAGALQILVPGNFPIGCLPSYLTVFGSDKSSSYDHRGCLQGLNQFAQLHNDQLKHALEELRQEYPHVLIMYADYYEALMDIINHSIDLGFKADPLAKACCGIGGNYNFDVSRMCGAEGVPVCPNPAQYIHWDGVHLTQNAYQLMAERLIAGGFTYSGSNTLKKWTCS